LVLHFTSNLKSWAGLVFATQYRDAFKICKGAIRLGRFILFADTEELIAEYERLGALKIHLAPIPSNLSVSKNLTISLNQENENQSEITQKKPIIVSFVGQARRDKGFYSLLEIVKNFSDEIHKHKIKFIVQTGPIDQLKLADREYIEKLRNFDVEIVDKILDKNAYYQLIETADVILLPYIGYSYNSQSSGIFSEAISMGKIIVAPDQSWMGRQLIRLGLKNQNKSIKRNHLVKQIVEDIHESVNNYHQINQNYRNARVKWIKYNDISFIIRELEF
jgi:glycosyltransferase involved in cell wall biosynthesis